MRRRCLLIINFTRILLIVFLHYIYNDQLRQDRICIFRLRGEDRTLANPFSMVYFILNAVRSRLGENSLNSGL